MTHFADLHIHTFFSDGSLSPRDVLEGGSRAGLTCLSICDHDTVDGVLEALPLAEDYHLEVIPGIELSSSWDGRDIHILGYFLDVADPAFQKGLSVIREKRIHRMARMIDRLRENGITELTVNEVLKEVRSRNVGRPHLARVLVKKGKCATVKEAFDRYIGDDGPAYVCYPMQTPFEAIAMIRSGGGIAVMAHPMVTRRDDMIPSLVDSGLEGIEVFYPNVARPVTEFYRDLAGRYGLLMTGGSDAHGEYKRNTFIGKAKIPYELIEKMKERLDQRR